MMQFYYIYKSFTTYTLAGNIHNVRAVYMYILLSIYHVNAQVDNEDVLDIIDYDVDGWCVLYPTSKRDTYTTHNKRCTGTLQQRQKRFDGGELSIKGSDFILHQ